LLETNNLTTTKSRFLVDPNITQLKEITKANLRVITQGQKTKSSSRNDKLVEAKRN